MEGPQRRIASTVATGVVAVVGAVGNQLPAAIRIRSSVTSTIPAVAASIGVSTWRLTAAITSGIVSVATRVREKEPDARITSALSTGIPSVVSMVRELEPADNRITFTITTAIPTVSAAVGDRSTEAKSHRFNQVGLMLKLYSLLNHKPT